MSLDSIAFIPDGNRRFAAANKLPLLQSYSLGTQKAWDVLDWLVKHKNIKEGTFYTLSLENLKRSSVELKALFHIFEKELDKIKQKPIFEREQIRLKFLGRRELFPKKLQEKIQEAEDYTENFNERTINLALAYDGQTEIVDAAKKIASDYADEKISLDTLNTSNFSHYLYSSNSFPDLIIRTSGTQRLSGFLTYQSAYSELYFINKYWPEFSEQDLNTAITEFESRERRFGK